MGTVLAAEIACGAAHGCPDAFEKILSALESVDRAMSVYHASEITRINNFAGAKNYLQPVSADTEQVLRAALSVAEASAGRFDITVKPLIDLYGFYRKGDAESLPSAAQLFAALALVGYRDLEIAAGSAGLRRKSMQIDLGGIAKGFALDKAAALLMGAGYTEFILNFGGQVLTHGSNIPVVVKNPLKPGRDLVVCEIRSGSVSVSAQSERYMLAQGKKIGHLLNPRSGQSEDSNLVSIVYHPQAMFADAWSTALFFTDTAAFMALTQKHALIAYRFGADGKLQVSERAQKAALCRL